MNPCEHCGKPGCTYPDHGGGESDNPHAPLSRTELFSALTDAEDAILFLREQRTTLRREVRRLNAKVAAMGAVITARQAWGHVEREREKRLTAGTAMWALRQALGLRACEVSNEDVLRAAARKLGKQGGA